jgi:ApaG protein
MSSIQYCETTNDIAVTVVPIYLDEESKPDDSKFIWAYHIRLENKGDATVQLINRHWQIANCQGMIQEVVGPGVVGVQPKIRPGEIFEYASGTHLETPSGLMVGTYEMVKEDGTTFKVNIPPFSLDSPEQRLRPN